jgi:large repetitive protein
VNTYIPDFQDAPAVAIDDAGDFVVVWPSQYQDGSEWGLFAQRYALRDLLA